MEFIVSSAKILFRSLDVDCILNSERCSMYQTLSLSHGERQPPIQPAQKTNLLIKNVKNYTRFETFFNLSSINHKYETLTLKPSNSKTTTSFNM